MKCLLLAAGYATRLYPLTENFPKPLLEVKGKTILNWLIDDLKDIDEFVVISNHKFSSMFVNWANKQNKKIIVIDDGTTTNETRLGAVKDIEYALDKVGYNDDCLVLAGDNVLDFSIQKFIDYAKNKNTSCVMRYYEENKEKIKKSAALELDGDLVVNMEEKPANPKSNWCCPPFYFYKKEDISLIKKAISEGCGTDAPGSLTMWMLKHSKIHAMEMPGKRYDIGTLESYQKIKEEYKGIK